MIVADSAEGKLPSVGEVPGNNSKPVTGFLYFVSGWAKFDTFHLLGPRFGFSVDVSQCGYRWLTLDVK